jgi:hypothetical protein
MCFHPFFRGNVSVDNLGYELLADSAVFECSMDKGVQVESPVMGITR